MATVCGCCRVWGSPFACLVAEEGEFGGIGIEEDEAVFAVLAFGGQDQFVAGDD